MSFNFSKARIKVLLLRRQKLTEFTHKIKDNELIFARTKFTCLQLALSFTLAGSEKMVFCEKVIRDIDF